MGLTEQLYGKHAAALYAQAADFNKTARFYYMKAQDAYYLANAQVFSLFLSLSRVVFCFRVVNDAGLRCRGGYVLILLAVFLLWRETCAGNR